MLRASVKRSPAEPKLHLVLETQRCMMGLMQVDVFGTLFIFLQELYSLLRGFSRGLRQEGGVKAAEDAGSWS